MRTEEEIRQLRNGIGVMLAIQEREQPEPKSDAAFLSLALTRVALSWVLRESDQLDDVVARVAAFMASRGIVQ